MLSKTHEANAEEEEKEEEEEEEEELYLQLETREGVRRRGRRGHIWCVLVLSGAYFLSVLSITIDENRAYEQHEALAARGD